MKLGLSSYTYSWAVGVKGYPPDKPLTVMDLLDKAVQSGVHLLQIIDNLPFERISREEWRDFTRRAHELKIDLEVGTSGIAPDHLRAFIGLARLFGSPFVRTVVDTPECKPSEDEIVRTIKSILPEFREAGLQLGIENHDRFKVQKWAEIIERIDSDLVGVVLDTTNSFGASQGPEVVIEVLGPRTINLHLKDYVVYRHSYLFGFTIDGRPAGQGHLDIPWLLRRMRELGRDPNVILELWTPKQVTLAETIALEERWAAASIECMRGYIPL
jgi:3-oxoisoapionate decarboxylase